MPKDIKSIEDLTPDSHNANKGSERGQYMIETSLRKVGAGRSIVVDKDGRVIGGNKTVEQWADIANPDDIEVIQSDGKKLVVVQRTDLDLADGEDTTARELAYYDNRSSEVSMTWDAEVLLADLAAEVPLHDFFHEDELDELLAEIDKGPEPTVGADTPPEINRANELQKEWGTELGQLWQCGPHRVLCGDCTDADVVERLMDGAKAEICFTSPPYTDQREYTNDGDLSIDYLSNFLLSARGYVGVFAVNLGLCRKDDEIVPYWNDYICKAGQAGMKLLSWNVWKQTGGFSIGQLTAMFPIEHEFIFVFGENRINLTPTIENAGGGKRVMATDRDAAGRIGDAKLLSYR